MHNIIRLHITHTCAAHTSSSRERKRRITPIQPHKADSGAARTSPIRYCQPRTQGKYKFETSFLTTGTQRPSAAPEARAARAGGRPLRPCLLAQKPAVPARRHGPGEARRVYGGRGVQGGTRPGPGPVLFQRQAVQDLRCRHALLSRTLNHSFPDRDRRTAHRQRAVNAT